jgi:hypothetical protein
VAATWKAATIEVLAPEAHGLSHIVTFVVVASTKTLLIDRIKSVWMELTKTRNPGLLWSTSMEKIKPIE